MLEDKHWLNGTILEPCVGNGALVNSLNQDKVTTYDINSTYPDVIIQDYLLAPINKHNLVFTNPPFGRNSSLALRFFNRATKDSNRLALILPQTFRKTTLVDRLNPYYHPLFDEDLPCQHFILPNGETRKVKTCFQLWEQRDYKRTLFKSLVKDNHYFSKVSHQHADFALRTQGSGAGNVLDKLYNDDGSVFSKGTTCYIKGSSKQITDLNLKHLSSFTASVPAIGLQDIRLALSLPLTKQNLFLNKGAASLLASEIEKN